MGAWPPLHPPPSSPPADPLDSPNGGTASAYVKAPAETDPKDPFPDPIDLPGEVDMLVGYPVKYPASCWRFKTGIQNEEIRITEFEAKGGLP